MANAKDTSLTDATINDAIAEGARILHNGLTAEGVVVDVLASCTVASTR